MQSMITQDLKEITAWNPYCEVDLDNLKKKFAQRLNKTLLFEYNSLTSKQ